MQACSQGIIVSKDQFKDNSFKRNIPSIAPCFDALPYFCEYLLELSELSRSIWLFYPYAFYSYILLGFHSIHTSFILSSQSRKFEFNVFSIIHLNGHNFDVLDRCQENKVLQTAQIMNNIPRSSKKWWLCHHGNRHLLNWKFRKIHVWL